jgi:hypothetical protein
VHQKTEIFHTSLFDHTHSTAAGGQGIDQTSQPRKESCDDSHLVSCLKMPKKVICRPLVIELFKSVAHFGPKVLIVLNATSRRPAAKKGEIAVTYIKRLVCV